MGRWESCVNRLNGLNSRSRIRLIVLEWFDLDGDASYSLYWEYDQGAIEDVPIKNNWKNYEISILNDPFSVNVLNNL